MGNFLSTLVLDTTFSLRSLCVKVKQQNRNYKSLTKSKLNRTRGKSFLNYSKESSTPQGRGLSEHAHLE